MSYKPRFIAIDVEDYISYLKDNNNSKCVAYPAPEGIMEYYYDFLRDIAVENPSGIGTIENASANYVIDNIAVNGEYVSITSNDCVYDDDTEVRNEKYKNLLIMTNNSYDREKEEFSSDFFDKVGEFVSENLTPYVYYGESVTEEMLLNALKKLFKNSKFELRKTALDQLTLTFITHEDGFIDPKKIIDDEFSYLRDGIIGPHLGVLDYHFVGEDCHFKICDFPEVWFVGAL